MRPFLSALAALLLVACSGTETVRYDVPPTAAADRVPVGIRTLEVREVGVPLYAGLEAISVVGPEGALLSDPDVLWADDPVRGITQGLADALGQVTRATVAAEPWPLSDGPDMQLSVRFSRVLAGADGQFRMRGQYFVAAPLGERRERSGRFDLAVPYEPGNTASIPAAQAAAIQQLARLIATESL